MGTRSGDLDPSIVTFLMKKENITPEEMDKILNKESGIYGISGVSADVRDIEQAASEGNEKAELALKAYDLNIAQYIAKYMVSMGGVDIITFTAGVGEKDPKERKKICDYLQCFGIKIDENKNNTIVNCEGKISSDESSAQLYVIPTNEELLIARLIGDVY